MFVEEPPEQLQIKCVICLCILKHPYLVDCCGTSYCQTCIDPIQQNNKPCPHCNVAFNTCIPDKRLQRTLNGMKVYCCHKQLGCERVGDLGKLAQHLNDQQEFPGCLFTCIECPFCNESFQRQNLQEHNIKQTSVINVHTAVTTATTISPLVKMSLLTTGQSALAVQCHVLMNVGFIQNERL